MQKEYDFESKLVFLGDTGVGKTSIISRYMENVFDVNVPSSRGAFHHEKILQVGRKSYKVYIWDTTGEERFKSMLTFYYRDAHMVALVYSTVSQDSIDNIRFWINEIQTKNNKKCAILLIGNKIDLKPNHNDADISGDIQSICNEFNIEHIYASAKQKVNIEQIFQKLITKADEKLIIENNENEFQGRKVTNLSKPNVSNCSC